MKPSNRQLGDGVNRVGFLSRSLALIFCCVSLASCASLYGSAREGRELVLEPSWVRSTLKEDFFLYRRAHRMTPIFSGTMVIQANAIDGMVAFDQATGDELWRLPLENGVEGGARLADGRLYFGGSNGQFYCVDAQTGKVVWTYSVRAETLAAPSVEEGVVYFQSGADVVYALDAATGKQLWLYNRQTTTNVSIRATTRPVVDGDFVYCGFSDGFLVVLSRRGGAVQWEKKLARNSRFMDVDGTPVIEGQVVYLTSFDGSLFALNKTSGDILWQNDEGGYTPVTLGPEALYYATTNGTVVALDKASGRKLWTVPVTHGIATQPTLLQSFLLFGESEGALVVIDARTGSELTRFDPGRGLLAAPAVVSVAAAADKKMSSEKLPGSASEKLPGSASSYYDIFFISNNANLYAMKLGYQKRTDVLPWQRKIGI